MDKTSCRDCTFCYYCTMIRHDKCTAVSSFSGRSQWPCGPGHELFSLPQTMWSWVRIPHEAWMCVLNVYVCVLCVGRGLAKGWPPSQGVLPLCIGSRNRKSGQDPTEGRRAIDEWISFPLLICGKLHNEELRQVLLEWLRHEGWDGRGM
jgi:hypothetical protein